MKKIITTRKYITDKHQQKILDMINIFTENIKNNNNFTIVKFGDGELISMMGPDYRRKENGELRFGNCNCDGHPFDSGGLGQKLMDSWYFFNELNNKYNNVYIPEWTLEPYGRDTTLPMKFFKKLKKETKGFNINFVHYEILLQNTLSQEKFNFYENIKNSKRKKIYVAPNRMHDGVSRFLNIDKCVSVPLENAHVEYDRILSDIQNEIVKDCIILFSCGMPAKSLIHKLLEIENEITCLDVGSGFDPIFNFQTREGQLETFVIKDYYKELL